MRHFPTANALVLLLALCLAAGSALILWDPGPRQRVSGIPVNLGVCFPTLGTPIEALGASVGNSGYTITNLGGDLADFQHYTDQAESMGQGIEVKFYALPPEITLGGEERLSPLWHLFYSVKDETYLLLAAATKTSSISVLLYKKIGNHFVLKDSAYSDCEAPWPRHLEWSVHHDTEENIDEVSLTLVYDIYFMKFRVDSFHHRHWAGNTILALQVARDPFADEFPDPLRVQLRGPKPSLEGAAVKRLEELKASTLADGIRVFASPRILGRVFNRDQQDRP